jgi:hypothetical protein
MNGITKEKEMEINEYLEMVNKRMIITNKYKSCVKTHTHNRGRILLIREPFCERITFE